MASAERLTLFRFVITSRRRRGRDLQSKSNPSNPNMQRFQALDVQADSPVGSSYIGAGAHGCLFMDTQVFHAQAAALAHSISLLCTFSFPRMYTVCCGRFCHVTAKCTATLYNQAVITPTHLRSTVKHSEDSAVVEEQERANQAILPCKNLAGKS